MTACQQHNRCVVVYEVGMGDCPLCVAQDKVRDADSRESDLREQVEHLQEEVEELQNKS
jgi:hypothetical protein